MRKTFFYFVIVVFTGYSHPVSAQPAPPVTETLKEEQFKFLADLRSMAVDSSIVYPLANAVESSMNKTLASIMADQSLSTAEKNKAVWSMVYFVKELNKAAGKRRIDVYSIPGAQRAYNDILTAIVHGKPWRDRMKPLDAERSQLIAAAFNQYEEHRLMDDIAVYKRMTASPEFILQYLESNPGFRFADSLLVEAAANDPLKLVYYLQGTKPRVREKLLTANNVYLQQIVTLAQHKNVTELLPFVSQLAEQHLSVDDVLQTRSGVVDYFQLMVNTLIMAQYTSDSSSLFLKTLRDGIHQKGLAFFVNEINDLHNEKDPVRFASVKSLRPEDLYYLITTCGDDLYTSSYLGLYRRLMEHFKEQPVDSLFDLVQFDNFHVFMRLAANYNVMSDFLSTLPAEKTRSLLSRFIAGIGRDADIGLERAMDIGDCFSGLGSSAAVNDMIRDELQSNLRNSRARQNFLGVRLYSILLNVFNLSRKGESLSKLSPVLGDYKMLKRSRLVNSNNEIVQLMLFYGDEDGITSFNNFLKPYNDTSRWSVTKTTSWISFRSKQDSSYIIYANLPLDIKEELDILAQDSLYAYLAERHSEPTILVHRGHSYHLAKTLKRMTPSVKLAILGSCGGYNKAISIATMNPDIQVIGSKKTGAGAINDPIIELINEDLVAQNDLYWPEIWDKLTARFSKNQEALSLFNEYLPPSKNVGLFVLKLFMHYNRYEGSTPIAVGH